MFVRADQLCQQFLGQKMSVAPCGHLQAKDLDCLKLAFKEQVGSMYTQACKFINVPKSVSRQPQGMHADRHTYSKTSPFPPKWNKLEIDNSAKRESEWFLIRIDMAPKLFKLWREYLKDEGPIVPFQKMEDAFNSDEHKFKK